MGDRTHVELADLLREHIATYEHLEVLLLLARDQHQAWSVEAVVTALRLTSSSGCAALEHLTKAGLLVRTSSVSGDRFCCHPDSASALRSLSRTNRDDRVQLMRVMSKNAVERVRRSALWTFAAAFRSGKK